MSFRENLKIKLNLDKLLKKVLATIREPPEQRYVDKKLVNKLLKFTDFEHLHVRDLDLYVRPEEKEKNVANEILVLDNELAIYHTVVGDVALRKSPIWKEMLSIKNIKNILNDQDVISSKGKASLSRIHALAVASLNLSWNDDDLSSMVADARLALESKSVPEILEFLGLFSVLADFRTIRLTVNEPGVYAFGGPIVRETPYEIYEHLILFHEREVWLRLIEGEFSPHKDLDLARVVLCIRGEEPAHIQGEDVFEFLAGLAYKEKEQPDRIPTDVGED